MSALRPYSFFVGRLVVVSGPPGAGKTNVAQHLAELTRSALVAGDAFFAALGDLLIPPWLPEADDQNGAVIEAAAAAAGRLASRWDVVYEGVVGPWFLPRFIAATGQPRVDYLVLLPPEEVCRGRVRSRVGHGFTDDDATRRMYADFAGGAVEPRHLLADLSGGPDAVAATVLSAIRSGRLAVEATSK